MSRRAGSSDYPQSDSSMKSGKSDDSKKSGKSENSKKSGKSDDSKNSGKSSGSKDSQKTQKSDSSHYTVLTKTISEDLGGAVEAMNTLVENNDVTKAEQYMEENAKNSAMIWTEEMKKKHAEYHYCRKERVKYKARYDNLKKQLQGMNPTLENFDELRKHGINWAENALQELEARIQFMMNYPRAFQYPKSYERHLTELKGVSNSASNAIRYVRLTRESLIQKRESSSTA
ncbi:uncharacterized protein EAE97_000388 [Botrytis byssoidea]|uniref:Uncharacterized protein n=1 Tax=Botrytis byssoidea TaxID=139641 RepID=A0A9P5IVA1_9HELO|nr:uncharacterized protein EAE97_000388 [Botrytis byssoidea]KAF7955129.1 hypothetical protein EAE97_000388 [Botrytis byssoidea]